MLSSSCVLIFTNFPNCICSLTNNVKIYQLSIAILTFSFLKKLLFFQILLRFFLHTGNWPFQQYMVDTVLGNVPDPQSRRVNLMSQSQVTTAVTKLKYVNPCDRRPITTPFEICSYWNVYRSFHHFFH